MPRPCREKERKQGMSKKTYKSSPPRLARVFEESRDRWKERAAQKQRGIRRLRVSVRDLKASRDHWKAEARQATQQLAELQACLAASNHPSLTPSPGGPCLGGH
jgi:hypothetical protein